jgi:hypothetical protein
VILEITSGNRHLDRLIMAHPGPCLLVLLHCPEAVCMARAAARQHEGYTYPPVPWINGDIMASIRYLSGILPLLEHDLTLDTTTLSPEQIAGAIQSFIAHE